MRYGLVDLEGCPVIRGLVGGRVWVLGLGLGLGVWGYIVLLQTEFGRTRYCIWGVRLSVCLSIMRCKFMRK